MTTLQMTTAQICALPHCYGPDDAIRALAGDRETWTALDVLDHPDVPDADKLWLVLRPELIIGPDLHELACLLAETVSHLWTDPRSQAAIDAKRAWLRGEISDRELVAAWTAARDAKDTARRAAASAAASAAAWDASWDAAWATARDAASAAAAWDAARAARDTARRAQVEIVRDYLVAKHQPEEPKL